MDCIERRTGQVSWSLIVVKQALGVASGGGTIAIYIYLELYLPLCATIHLTFYKPLTLTIHLFHTSRQLSQAANRINMSTVMVCNLAPCEVRRANLGVQITLKKGASAEQLET